VHAVWQGEPAQWPLGNALIEECGKPGDDHAHNGAYSQICEAQAELLANGIDRALNSLQMYRESSHWFPCVTRITGAKRWPMSW
jgi:hypothetical protein